MSTSVEQHGCIVCGKTYTLKVTYDRDGEIRKCVVTTLGGRRVIDSRRPLVACHSHSAAEINSALASHYPGDQEKNEDD